MVKEGGRDFQPRPDTEQTIRDLTARLKSGAVDFFDVLAATSKHWFWDSGEAPYKGDAGIESALGDFAEAMAESFKKTGEEKARALLFVIGKKVATGEIGAPFFNGIRKSCG